MCIRAYSGGILKERTQRDLCPGIKRNRYCIGYVQTALSIPWPRPVSALTHRHISTLFIHRIDAGRYKDDDDDSAKGDPDKTIVGFVISFDISLLRSQVLPTPVPGASGKRLLFSYGSKTAQQLLPRTSPILGREESKRNRQRTYARLTTNLQGIACKWRHLPAVRGNGLNVIVTSCCSEFKELSTGKLLLDRSIIFEILRSLVKDKATSR